MTKTVFGWKCRHVKRQGESVTVITEDFWVVEASADAALTKLNKTLPKDAAVLFKLAKEYPTGPHW